MHMTHVANPPNQQTEIGVASGSGAGQSGSENPKIIPLPVYHGDVCGSLLGTMLFPNDAAKAESYCTQLLQRDQCKSIGARAIHSPSQGKLPSSTRAAEKFPVERSRPNSYT